MLKRKKRDGLGIGLADHRHKSPLRADEQDTPQPERPETTKDDAEQLAGNQRHPSQAEGERER